MSSSASTALPDKYGPTPSDIVFLVFLFLAMLGVGWVGHLAYKEGMKVEVTKRNGEAWAKWLAQAGLERGNEGYEFSACSTGFIPPAMPTQAATVGIEPAVEGLAEVKTDASSTGSIKVPTPLAAPMPRTWGPCFKVLSSQGGPMADTFNPFSNKPLVIVPKCDMADRSVAGAMSLEKTISTPPGSAIPFLSSSLIDSDSIERKMQIRITMCDKGAYPIRIAELEF